MTLAPAQILFGVLLIEGREDFADHENGAVAFDLTYSCEKRPESYGSVGPLVVQFGGCAVECGKARKPATRILIRRTSPIAIARDRADIVGQYLPLVGARIFSRDVGK